uniref:Uncharacterized protein n=1 Tax=Kwoniella bestiolae CBS 10118 TaxID=1296100 RepID=A0A1B9GD42_9TREE|nr:hypothetical protein I302_00428 [Kwoniella bestiolae CBS 10118]OCF28938.1 hypothetical protein I302_00428 [Kwoniella bestiolae CBS 10118]
MTTANFISTPSGKTLPVDIIHHILTDLQKTQQLGSLANLRACSETQYQLITPYLYKDITVNGPQFKKLFDPLVQCSIKTNTITTVDPQDLEKDWRVAKALGIHWALSKIHCITFDQSINDVLKDETSFVGSIESMIHLSENNNERLLHNLWKVCFNLKFASIEHLQEIHTITGIIAHCCYPVSICVRHIFLPTGLPPSILDRYWKYWTKIPIKDDHLVYHDIGLTIPLIPAPSRITPRVSLSKCICTTQSHTCSRCKADYPISQKNFLNRLIFGLCDKKSTRCLRVVQGREPQSCTEDDLTVLKGDLIKRLKVLFRDHPEDTARYRIRFRNIREWPEKTEWVRGEEALREPPWPV